MSENIQVPQGWEVKKLGEVCDSIVRGPFGSALKKEYFIDYEKSAYKVYEQKNAIQENHKLGNYFISEEKFRTLKRFECKPNDIIMSCSGTIGKLYTIPFNAHKGIINQALLKITLNNKIIDYIFKILFSFEINKLTLAGSGIQNISSIKYLKNIAIPVPPLEEQKKIADILSLWDKAIEQTKELIAYKEKQKKGLMQALLTGKKRLNGFTDEWKTTKLGDITNMNSGGTPTTTKQEYYNGNINWVSITDMTSSYKYLYKTKTRITELGLQNSTARLFPINTVLYAMYASIGECIIAKEEMATSQAILGIRCSDKLNHEYLFYLLYNYKDKSKKLAQQGTQANLNKEIVENFIFKIPTSLNEQKAIADILSSADEEIELLNKQLELYTEQKKGLMQNLLTGKVRV